MLFLFQFLHSSDALYCTWSSKDSKRRQSCKEKIKYHCKPSEKNDKNDETDVEIDSGASQSSSELLEAITDSVTSLAYLAGLKANSTNETP